MPLVRRWSNERSQIRSRHRRKLNCADPERTGKASLDCVSTNIVAPKASGSVNALVVMAPPACGTTNGTFNARPASSKNFRVNEVAEVPVFTNHKRADVAAINRRYAQGILQTTRIR